MDELNSLQDINIDDLDKLEARLTDAEDRVAQARLSERMASLVDKRNQQNAFIKEHQHNIAMLAQEVHTVRKISEALPEGCFKRTRLEL